MNQTTLILLSLSEAFRGFDDEAGVFRAEGERAHLPGSPEGGATHHESP